MKREQAEAIALQLLNHLELASHFTKYEICGSIRRKKEEVNDIDIVAIPKVNYAFGEHTLEQDIDFIDDTGKAEAKAMGKSGVKRFLNGESIKRFKYRDIMIDLYLADHENYEVLRLIRTGSAQHNIKLTSIAIGKGMKLFASGAGLWKVIRNPDDPKNPTPIELVSRSENEILKILLGTVPAPEERN